MFPGSFLPLFLFFHHVIFLLAVICFFGSFLRAAICLTKSDVEVVVTKKPGRANSQESSTHVINLSSTIPTPRLHNRIAANICEQQRRPLFLDGENTAAAT